jgi:hypothetical protein
MPHGRTVTVAEFKNIAIRCPLPLVQAVEALRDQRAVANPYQIPSIGAVYRELLARGLDALATETAGRK